MKLTKAREKVLAEVVRHHRLGREGYLEVGRFKHWDARPINALIKMGFLKRTDINGEELRYFCVEITSAGWDYIYRINPYNRHYRIVKEAAA